MSGIRTCLVFGHVVVQIDSKPLIIRTVLNLDVASLDYFSLKYIYIYSEALNTEHLKSE